MILAQVAPVAGTGTIAEYLQFGAAGVLAVVIAWLLKQASAREKLHADTVQQIGAAMQTSSDRMSEAIKDSAEKNSSALGGIQVALDTLTRAVMIVGVTNVTGLRLLPGQPSGGKRATADDIAEAARSAVASFDLTKR